MSELAVREAIEQLVARIPNLLSAFVVEKFTGHRSTVVHSQDQVAALIGAVLPDGLKAAGYAVVGLPAAAPDGYDGISVRVALSSQPWADAELRITRSRRGGNLIVSGIPNPLTVEDAPIVAAALLAVYETRPRTTRIRD